MFIDPTMVFGPLWKRVSKGKENCEIGWLRGTADDGMEVDRDQRAEMEKWGGRGESNCCQGLDVRLERSLV